MIPTRANNQIHRRTGLGHHSIAPFILSDCSITMVLVDRAGRRGRDVVMAVSLVGLVGGRVGRDAGGTPVTGSHLYRRAAVAGIDSTRGGVGAASVSMLSPLARR